MGEMGWVEGGAGEGRRGGADSRAWLARFRITQTRIGLSYPFGPRSSTPLFDPPLSLRI